MPRAKKDSTLKDLEKTISRKTTGKYLLKLYVAGISRRSSQAIKTITGICEENLNGNYELEVIDIYQQPTLAKGEQIIAAPTLIRKLPLPLRRLIGDMAGKDKVLLGLDIKSKT